MGSDDIWELHDASAATIPVPPAASVAATVAEDDVSTPDSERILRIVIADDHPIFRRGLRQLLENQSDLEVVAEGEDAESARRYILGHHPDILVIDLNMPGRPVLEVIPELRAEFPDTQIIVLTMQNEPAYARRALAGGALGYVLKDAAAQELVTAVRAASRGESFLNPRLGAVLASQAAEGSPGGLSDRELQVAGMLALGYTNAQIGEKLYISTRTVETHRAHIQQKLGISDRRGLVEFAFTHGLVDGL